MVLMFDEEKASRATKFIKKLRHTKGDWAGKTFNLIPWEEKIVRDLFGTVNEDGKRQYREAYISVARKNGKTEICGALGNYCLFADGEQGSEVYCAAGDRDQASLVYGAAKSMVEQNATLDRNSKIVDSVKRIIFPKRNSFLRALSSEAFSKHGYNPHLAICDEVHVWPGRDLYDVLKTGMGARSQPLLVSITTAGFDRTSLCWELYTYAKKIISGAIQDPTFYAAIYEVEENEDWKDEANWYKANPGLGIYRSIDEMRQAFKRACEVPAFENTFRRLYLNQWTSAETRWLSLEKWDLCSDPVHMDSLWGRPCYGGLDLSTTTDITAFALVFEPGADGIIDLLVWMWMPEAAVKKPFDLWVRQKHIETTDGNVVDYEVIRAKVNEVGKIYNIRDIGYDPWNATNLAINLQQDGFVMVPVRQGYASLSAPTKELMNMVLQKRIRHGGNPVLRNMVDSLMITQDSAGNIKPAKDKSTSRIDGVVASIIAIDRLTREENATSVYENRGILTIEKEPPNEVPKPIEPSLIDLESADKCLRCATPIPAELSSCPGCGRIR